MPKFFPRQTVHDRAQDQRLSAAGVLNGFDVRPQTADMQSTSAAAFTWQGFGDNDVRTRQATARAVPERHKFQGQTAYQAATMKLGPAAPPPRMLIRLDQWERPHGPMLAQTT